MLKKCRFCGRDIPRRAGRGGNASKFCGRSCRNKLDYIKRGGAEAQRKYLDKKREEDPRGKIQCRICGKYYRQVGSHIFLTHKITARDYREAYGFDVKRGQLPEDYRELKAEQAVFCGGAKNLKKGKKYWFKKGQKGVGVYKRSEQTMERLRNKQPILMRKGGEYEPKRK